MLTVAAWSDEVHASTSRWKPAFDHFLPSKLAVLPVKGLGWGTSRLDFLILPKRQSMLVAPCTGRWSCKRAAACTIQPKASRSDDRCQSSRVRFARHSRWFLYRSCSSWLQVQSLAANNQGPCLLFTAPSCSPLGKPRSGKVFLLSPLRYMSGKTVTGSSEQKQQCLQSSADR